MLSREAAAEALLFTAAEPVPTARLAECLGTSIPETEHCLRHLTDHLAGRGLMLQSGPGGWQLVTRPEAHDIIERYYVAETKPLELSKAALETLSVITFQGPVGQAEIEKVRGVASDQSLRTLLGRGLIEEVPRAGQAPRYAVSHRLLQELGVSHTGELAEKTDAA